MITNLTYSKIMTKLINKTINISTALIIKKIHMLTIIPITTILISNKTTLENALKHHIDRYIQLIKKLITFFIS